MYHLRIDFNFFQELKKCLLPKFQLIPILGLQVMHDYVQWHCSIDYCVKLSFVDKTLCKK